MTSIGTLLGNNMLNETVKRHLQFFGERYLRGESVLRSLEGYINDIARERLVVPEDAAEIYDAFMDSSTVSLISKEHDKESNSYKAMISKIKYVIREVQKRNTTYDNS